MNGLKPGCGSISSILLSVRNFPGPIPSNNSISTINFWPNPVNDQLNIHGNYELITIRNIEGKIIAILTNTETLDVSDWAAGFYFMEVKISGKNEYYKISKM